VTETTLREVRAAASVMGLRIRILNAHSGGDIHAAFATFQGELPDALFVSGGFLFSSRRVQLVPLGDALRCSRSLCGSRVCRNWRVHELRCDPAKTLRQN